MRKKLGGVALGAGVLAALAGPGAAAAHLHPYLPIACAPEATGAGNESEGLRTAPWVPDAGRFIIQLVNPGAADAHQNFLAPNPGVDDATANCPDPQDP